jgi:hypothetical protein
MSNIFSSMGIDPGIIIIILMITTIGLIGVIMYLYRTVKKIDERYKVFMKGEDGKTLERSFMRKFNQIEKMNDITTKLSEDIKRLEDVKNRSLIKYGIVKYDAFDDVGGKLSFSLALLNQTDTGFVLNAIHSKENCFLYIKEVMNGESYIILSDEEVQALRIARKYGDDKEVI